MGLRRQYVDLDKAVIYVDWQLKLENYRHGCPDPHACGQHWHIYPCPADCPKAKRTSGRKHICRKPCPPDCDQHGGKCPKFCAPNCTTGIEKPGSAQCAVIVPGYAGIIRVLACACGLLPVRLEAWPWFPAEG